ncbi:UDP-glycosyltransferase 87A1-like [Papaver somniferum]|uniref:UDP-glycosyltransferase 87A1-like n=1 Tax=Papaver somniferum TaxID=3469 RepID=UPI000E6F6CF5|nr:UDP-glycosyltransferase 87A1-like [Papaver somniferum]
MGEINEEPKSVKRCHIVAVPFPGRGLINPMLNFCKHLAHKLGDNVRITYVITEEWLGILESTIMPPQIHLRSMPNVIPSEFTRSLTLDFASFLEIVVAKSEAPFEHVLNTSGPANVILADFYLTWAYSIGSQRNIPVVIFWTTSSFVFFVLCHADLLTKNGHNLANISADMPLIPRGNDPKFNPEMVAFTMLDWPFIPNTTTIIEHHHHIHDKETESSTTLHVNNKEPNYIEWLDVQPMSSVMYIAFGSTVSIPWDQMKEILAGLHKSGVRYLLVLPGGSLNSDIHGEGDGDNDEGVRTSDQRLIVPWCDQLRVLFHSSVGGFWTHCGWNSTMESIYAGVPMLTFPKSFDQIPNRKLIVDDLKVGMKVMKDFGEKTLVRRDEIGKIVKRFMNINEEAEEYFNNEATEMRRRSSELKEICRTALAKGGSSDTNLTAFIKDILDIHVN